MKIIKEGKLDKSIKVVDEKTGKMIILEKGSRVELSKKV